MNKSIITAATSAIIAVGAATVPFLEVEDATELIDYQAKCTRAQAWFDLYIVESTKGKMRFTDGEAWRPKVTALQYAARGIGSATSLHIQRLARDKNLILNGRYTSDPNDYEMAGVIWETIGPKFGVQSAWGGRFGDANHFSCAWGGMK